MAHRHGPSASPGSRRDRDRRAGRAFVLVSMSKDDLAVLAKAAAADHRPVSNWMFHICLQQAATVAKE